MSFQGFQGDVGSVGGGSGSASTHLAEVQKRFAARKAAEEAARQAAALNNRTLSGNILDTNKPAGGSVNNTSAFQIIGGRAVPRGAAGANISRSVPSLKLRDGRRVTADSPNLTPAQKQALGIITGQQQATFNLAQKISAERRAQQLSGKTVEEAQRIATGNDSSKFLSTNPETQRDGGFAFTQRDRNIINTSLQSDIIRSNAAKLGFAEELIRAQQLDPNGFGSIDNLEELLANAPNQDAPINRINVQGDEQGNLVSPRNVKLQIENAGLTGGLTQPTLNIVGTQGTMPNIEEVQQVIQQSLSDITDNADIGNLTTVTQLPDGTLAIDFSEESPQIFRETFGDAVFEALGQYFDLRDQGVDDFFDNPEGLRLKFGEEEVQVGGSSTGGGGFAGDLLDNQGFDLIGTLTNPIVLIAIAAIAGLVIFTKYGRGSLNGAIGKMPLVNA